MKAGFAAALVLVASPVLAQPQDFSKVEVKAEKVAEGLYVLFGSDGNIGVAPLKAAGKTRDEVVAAKPTADHDARWASDFMKGDVFAGILYDSLK